MKSFEQALLIFFGFAGIILMLFATSQGVGLSPDSALYISAARNLLAGNGLTEIWGGELKPLNQYPPLFPLMLAIPGAVGIDPLVGARWLNALFFGANIVLVGNIVRAMCPSSPFAPILASFLMLTSVEMYAVHTMALSEAPFIFFSLLGLAALVCYLEDYKRAFLLIAASSTGLAFLTRYPGIVLVFVGGVTLLFLSRREQRHKIADTLLFGAIASVPIAIWFVRNLLLGTSTTGREPGIYGISKDELEGGLATFSTWFLPARFAGPLVGGLLLCVIITLSMLYHWRHNSGQTKCVRQSSKFIYLSKISAIFIVSYIVFLILSMSFVEPGSRIDGRILSPVYVLVLVVLVSWIAHLPQASGLWSITRTLMFFLLAMLAALHLSRAPGWIATIHRNGQVYASTAWRTSRIIDFVRNLPTEAVIFSNGPDAVYLLTNRMTRSIPPRVDDAGRPNRQYDAQVAEMQATLRKYDGHLVYFSLINWCDFFPSMEDLKNELPLKPIFEVNDGAVFTIGESNINNDQN